MDAALVAQWNALCQLLAPAFTGPTLVTFLHLATGWVMCRSRFTVTSVILTVGERLLDHAAKHWTSYERFFYLSVWSLAEVSQLLLVRVIVPLLDEFGEREDGQDQASIQLMIDDTTAARHGKHVAFARYFKDASVGNALKTVCHWSHNWVIGCVHFRCRLWPDWVIPLPVWFSLYRKKPDCDKAHPFRSRHQLAAQMLEQTRAALPGRKIEVGADGQYATHILCEALRAGESLVSRMRSDAALHEPPPKRQKGRGRPRLKGKRLPTPAIMAARRTKGWRTIQVLAYGRMVERQVLSIVCLWPRVCRYNPIKLVIVRDPTGKQKDDFFFCTDPTASEERIVERAAARWPIEDCIRDGKQQGGFEQVQGWCRKTVERQAPFGLIVQTLVKAWYIRYASGAKASSARPKGSEVCGWLPEEKAHPSYLDMLATLRRVLWRDRLNSNSTLGGKMRGIWKALQFTLCAAA